MEALKNLNELCRNSSVDALHEYLYRFHAPSPSIEASDILATLERVWDAATLSLSLSPKKACNIIRQSL